MRFLLVALLCALSYAQTAWTVCYTDDESVLMNSETSSPSVTDAGADNYRADCSQATFNQVRYVNLETNEVACFMRNSGSITLGSSWSMNDPEAWTTTGGVASSGYSYQLNVCSSGWMTVGLMITGITNNCRKACNNWCNDGSSPYFRMDGDNGGSYNGVAFNENGHRNVNNKLVQVSVRQSTETTCEADTNQQFSYRGCYTSGWSRRSADVPINEAGVITCQEYCNDNGFAYFGLECPHDNGAEVHCECANSLNAAESVSDELCQQIANFNTHCVGPFVVETGFGTYMMGSHGYNSAYTTAQLDPSVVISTTSSSTSPVITMEMCRDDASALPISEVTGERTVITGDTVSINIDYPGYMTLLSIEFIGDRPSPFLNTWTIESSDLCREANSVSRTGDYGSIAENYEITRNGEFAEFSMLVDFMYYTQSDVSEVAQAVTVQKEIKFRITAPQTVVVSVSANFQPGSALLYDIMSHGVIEENGVSLIRIEFRTFMAAGHSLTGDCSVMSDYFSGETTCTASEPEAFTHSVEGEGTLRTWTISAQNPNQCISGEHTERLEVDLTTSSSDSSGNSLTERIEFVINMIDELGPDCGVEIGEFEMTTSVQVSDGSLWIDTDDLGESDVFFLDSVIYFMVSFESYMEPTSVDITSLAIAQDNEPKCGGDCLDVVELVCGSCDETGVSAGGVYNFSMVLTSANALFEAQPGVNTPTTMDMTFSLAYTRRNLLQVSDVFNVPVKFSLRDYDCHEPNGLLSDVETVGCGLSSMTKTMLCRDGGWKELSQCSENLTGIVSMSVANFAGLIFSIVLIVVLVSRVFFQKSNDYTKIINEEPRV